MANGTPASPKALVGASIPRSGHHFLQNLLSRYFGDRMFYCETYSPADCCHTFPCTRRGGHVITYQKSHDREQEVPKDMGDAFYIMQFRHPVPEALSDRELDLNDGLGRRTMAYRLTKDHYATWLAQKAIYYRKYHDKWMVNRVKNGVYLDYTEMAKDPRPAMREIVSWASGSVDEGTLERVIQEAGATRVSTPQGGAAAKPFKPRVVEDSPYFDADLLGAFEAYVLHHCPAFGFSRMLPGTYENHPLFGLILMMKPDDPLPAGQGSRLAVAAKLAPDHPDIAVRLAQKDFRDGKMDEGIARLTELTRRKPFYAPGYKLLFSASKKAGKPLPAAQFDGNSIMGVSENADLLAEMGAAFLAIKYISNAATALSLALTLAPDHSRANHFMAQLLVSEKRWAQAEPYALKATQLDPANNPAAKLLTRIRQKAA